MNWKEQLEEADIYEYDDLLMHKIVAYPLLEKFIETEIIEELIEEIPSELPSAHSIAGGYENKAYTAELKQQLRAKWLGEDYISEKTLNDARKAFGKETNDNR